MGNRRWDLSPTLSHLLRMLVWNQTSQEHFGIVIRLMNILYFKCKYWWLDLTRYFKFWKHKSVLSLWSKGEKPLVVFIDNIFEDYLSQHRGAWEPRAPLKLSHSTFLGTSFRESSVCKPTPEACQEVWASGDWWSAFSLRSTDVEKCVCVCVCVCVCTRVCLCTFGLLRRWELSFLLGSPSADALQTEVVCCVWHSLCDICHQLLPCEKTL